MNPTSVTGTIVQEITIDGSAERIFEALTNPHERMKWWGAEGRFQVTHFESDLRPGGKWTMRGKLSHPQLMSHQLLSHPQLPFRP